MRTREQMSPAEAALTEKLIAGAYGGALTIIELTDDEWLTLRKLIQHREMYLVDEPSHSEVFIAAQYRVSHLVMLGWLPKPEPRPVEAVDLSILWDKQPSEKPNP